MSARRRRIMTMFAERLKRAREAKYPSAEYFAYLMGIKPHTYRKYERGDCGPSLDTLQRICGLLDITPNDLLLDGIAYLNDAEACPISLKPEGQ